MRSYVIIPDLCRKFAFENRASTYHWKKNDGDSNTNANLEKVRKPDYPEQAP